MCYHIKVCFDVQIYQPLSGFWLEHCSVDMFYVHTVYAYKILLASEASETLSGITNGNRIYIYIYMVLHSDTLVAWAWCYEMWEELSVSHF